MKRVYHRIRYCVVMEMEMRRVKLNKAEPDDVYGKSPNGLQTSRTLTQVTSLLRLHTFFSLSHRNLYTTPLTRVLVLPVVSCAMYKISR